MLFRAGLAFQAHLVLFSSPLTVTARKPAASNLQSSNVHQCVAGAAVEVHTSRIANTAESMEISLVDKSISRQLLLEMARERFGNMVKAGVDIDQRVMAIGGGLHADEESFLLERGSRQENLWEINIHPRKDLPEMVEFDSLINIRPRQDNLSRYVEDSSVRDRIIAIVGALMQ